MKNIVTPLIYKQQKYTEYGVCPKTGNVFSSKYGNWRPLKWKVSGKSKYPQVGIYSNGNAKTISVHVAVHETLKPSFPPPPGVSAKEWNRTPKSVKNIARELYEVNHIDHNVLNFKPSNLEWATANQNVQKYQQHRIRTQQ